MLTTSEQRLLRITKLDRKTVGVLKEGISIEASLSRSIQDAMFQTVADRLDLADEFLNMADALMRSRHDLYRAAIARYYYSMYHAMRAASYQHFEGDDHESHSDLSSKGVPPDFPGHALAQNTLKDARLRRNEADYEQYPRNHTHFKSQARSLQVAAKTFVTTARQYVSSKGNPFS